MYPLIRNDGVPILLRIDSIAARFAVRMFCRDDDRMPLNGGNEVIIRNKLHF